MEWAVRLVKNKVLSKVSWYVPYESPNYIMMTVPHLYYCMIGYVSTTILTQYT